jgi:alkylation response protein AidB-like acyl-CoA dehydrogenase
VRFALSGEQRQFAAGLHDLLSGTTGGKVWRRLAELGVLALAHPDSGASAVDLVVAFEELGHHAVPGPVVETIAAVPTLLAAAGAGREWLPRLASGELTASVADGSLAVEAELILAVEAGTLYLATPAGPPLSSVDPTRRLVEVRRGDVVAAGVDASRAFDLAALATAAVLLGAGRAMLELTVGYAGQRTQFGRPIGAFQAVKHQLADVLVGLELARPLVHGAAVTGSPRDVSAAKVAATLAADRAARVALQVHGAIGYTVEYGLGRWLTKVRALRCTWGTLAVHRERVTRGGTE